MAQHNKFHENCGRSSYGNIFSRWQLKCFLFSPLLLGVAWSNFDLRIFFQMGRFNHQLVPRNRFWSILAARHLQLHVRNSMFGTPSFVDWLKSGVRPEKCIGVAIFMWCNKGLLVPKMRFWSNSQTSFDRIKWATNSIILIEHGQTLRYLFLLVGMDRVLGFPRVRWTVPLALRMRQCAVEWQSGKGDGPCERMNIKSFLMERIFSPVYKQFLPVFLGFYIYHRWLLAGFLPSTVA